MATSLDISDPRACRRLGLRLGELARPGDIILLEGTLGAGKTTLTRCIGEGLNLPAESRVTSPTFAIIHEHHGRLPLYHVDLYRLGGEDEIEDLGLEDYLYGEGLCVIEWPQRLGGALPAEYLRLTLDLFPDGSRRATLTARGAGWEERLDALLDAARPYGQTGPAR